MEEFSYFSELPAEIQLKILEEFPELLKSSLSLNKEIRQLILPTFAKKFCSMPISVNEFLQYVNMRPSSFGVWYNIIPRYQFYLYVELFKDTYFVIDTAIDVDDDMLYVIASWINYDDRVEYVIKSTSHIISLISSKNCTFDLKTQYSILMQRRPCIDYQENYAKITILKQLDDVYVSKQSERIIDIFNVYLYLANHCIILKTDYIPEFRDIHIDVDEETYDEKTYDDLNPDDQIKFTEIKNDIEVMYPLIREYLLKL